MNNDLDTCDRCTRAADVIHVGQAAWTEYDGLCSDCYDELAAQETTRMRAEQSR